MLRKNKIAGISFHHSSSRKFSKPKYRLQDFFNLDDLFVQIKTDSPTPLSKSMITRLLGDHGRNEINSLVSQCIDQSTKWKGILKIIERAFPQQYFLHPERLLSEYDSENFSREAEIEIYLEVKKLLWLWKHNLNILQMAADAQYFVGRL